MMLALGLLYMAFIMLRCSDYNSFLKNFIVNQYWILSKSFSISIEVIILFLFFNFFNVYHKCVSLICGYWTILAFLRNITLALWMLSFDSSKVLFNYFASILLRILHLFLSVILAYNFTFFVISLSNFGIGVMLVS